jgi:hypothetical protein
LGLDVDLERSKHLHIQQALRLEEEKLQLQKADNLASKFTAALEIPKMTSRNSMSAVTSSRKRSPTSTLAKQLRG